MHLGERKGGDVWMSGVAFRIERGDGVGLQTALGYTAVFAVRNAGRCEVVCVYGKMSEHDR